MSRRSRRDQRRFREKKRRGEAAWAEAERVRVFLARVETFMACYRLLTSSVRVSKLHGLAAVAETIPRSHWTPTIEKIAKTSLALSKDESRRAFLRIGREQGLAPPLKLR